MTNASIADRIAAHAAKRAQGAWYPASGGTEIPFTTRTGAVLQYMFQPATGRHAYLDCRTDLILEDAHALTLLEGLLL